MSPQLKVGLRCGEELQFPLKVQLRGLFFCGRVPLNRFAPTKYIVQEYEVWRSSRREPSILQVDLRLD
jgi:hypothetical protein